MMLDLFGHPTVTLPNGFTYKDNFISQEEESILLAQIKAMELHSFNFHGFEAKRQVITFGYDYSFDNKSLTQGLPIPENLQWLIRRVAELISVVPDEIGEVLVTLYPQGSVINWHRDAPPFDIIAGVSLLSDCVFKLRPHDKTKQARKSTLSFPVKRRSVYVMRDQARTVWQHSIAPVSSPRYSITLRTLRKKG
jgi:alkylated DNA repair dioxygenase AlkB